MPLAGRRTQEVAALVDVDHCRLLVPTGKYGAHVRDVTDGNIVV
jgi:hypothetical protein